MPEEMLAYGSIVTALVSALVVGLVAGAYLGVLLVQRTLFEVTRALATRTSTGDELATIADALSTAFSWMSPQEITRVLASDPGLRAWVLPYDGDQLVPMHS